MLKIYCEVCEPFCQSQPSVRRRGGSGAKTPPAAVAIHWVACRVYESHDRASDMLVVGVLLGQRSISIGRHVYCSSVHSLFSICRVRCNQQRSCDRAMTCQIQLFLEIEKKIKCCEDQDPTNSTRRTRIDVSINKAIRKLIFIVIPAFHSSNSQSLLCLVFLVMENIGDGMAVLSKSAVGLIWLGRLLE